jgi:hypothetical protein
MMQRMGWILLSTLAVMVSLSAPASAAYDLQVTEIWPGNEPGDNLSPDWFEITNFGDTDWVAANDGDLWYDDDSFDAGAADPISGVASIPAGGSAVFLVSDNADDIPAFTSLWSSTTPTPLSLFPIGIVDGSGLGQGGDGVGIWITAETTPTGLPDVMATYPDSNLNGGQSYDVGLSAFSVIGNENGAVDTTMLNDMNQGAIGSPGTRRVPEPAAISLGILGVACLVGRLRHRRLK